MVWVDNYFDYVEFMTNLQSVSNMNDYGTMEMLDFYPGYAAQGDALQETHNYFAGSKDDINLFLYIGNQFAWGKKVFTFYRHPTDDNKGARATKNTMGRWSAYFGSLFLPLNYFTYLYPAVVYHQALSAFCSFFQSLNLW